MPARDIYAFLTLADNTTLQAKLIIGADGAHSWLRRHEKISVFGIIFVLVIEFILLVKLVFGKRMV